MQAAATSPHNGIKLMLKTSPILSKFIAFVLVDLGNNQNLIMQSYPESRQQALFTARKRAFQAKRDYQCANIKDLQRKYWLSGALRRMEQASNPQRQRYLLEVGLQAYLD